MKKTKHLKKPSQSSKKIGLWTVAILLIIGALFAGYKYLTQAPVIAGVMDDYTYNLSQKAAGATGYVTQYESKAKSAGQIQVEAAKTLESIAKTSNDVEIKRRASKAKDDVDIGVKAGTITQNDVKKATEKVAADDVKIAAAKTQIETKTAGPVADTTTACPGAGSNIGGGQWAQTGGGIAGTNTRYCVQCGGTRGGKAGQPGVWGDTQEICGQGNAKTYITRPDEVLDCKDPTNTNKTPNCTEGKVQGACWRGGTWYSDTSKNGNDLCFDGNWKNPDEYKKLMAGDNTAKGRCGDLGYNEATFKCNEAPPLVPADLPLGGTPNTKCGTGFTVSGAGCKANLPPDRIDDLAKTCTSKGSGMHYDYATGNCLTASQSIAPVKPAIDLCKETAIKNNTSTSKSYLTCGPKGEQIYQFCDSGFKAGGANSCDLEPVTFGNTSSSSGAEENYSGIVSRTVASCSSCMSSETCQQGANGPTCVNEKLLSPSWDFHFPEQGETGSIVKNPAECEELSTATGMPGQYRCVTQEQGEQIANTNEAIVGFFIKKPGEPGSIVKDPSICKIGSVKSSSMLGQYQCLSEAGLKQVESVNNFFTGVVNTIFKKPGEPGSIVKDPTTCSEGSMKAAVVGQYQCLTYEQAEQNKKINEAIVGFFIKKPGEPGSIVKDPTTCKIGSVKSTTSPGQYQCLSEAGLKQVEAVNGFVQDVVNAVFKKPGEPGSIVKDPTTCKIGSVPSGTGQYRCLTQKQKEANDEFNASIEKLFAAPKTRSVDSCEACVTNEGCVVGGLSTYQCVSVE